MSILHSIVLGTISLLVLCSIQLSAQSVRSTVREGNKLYEQGRFADAGANYKQALESDKTLNESLFNLGDALYKQGKYEEAADQFRLLSVQKDVDKQTLAKTYHNIGNALLKKDKLDESVHAYKQALKMNPQDAETRYNLAYAQAKLQQEQQQQNKDQKNDKDKQQDQQQKQEQKQNQQKQDNQNQQQQNQAQNQQKNQQQQQNQAQAQNKPSISKADAERILEALNNDEKNVQKKLVKKKATPIAIEKDW